MLMKKTNGKKFSLRGMKKEDLLIRALIAAVILSVVLLIAAKLFGGSDSDYTITSDGHVHAADGTHIGTVEDIYGASSDNIIITDDGHVHTADGTHIGSAEELGLSAE